MIQTVIQNGRTDHIDRAIEFCAYKKLSNCHYCNVIRLHAIHASNVLTFNFKNKCLIVEKLRFQKSTPFHK